MQADWELSQQLVSESQGMRAAGCILLPQTDNDNDNDDDVEQLHIVTGNQGGGLCAFGIPSGSIFPIEYQHNHSVMAVLPMKNNCYITGCKDSQIRIFDATTHQLEGTLKGHDKPVTSLALCQTSSGATFLVSGSWDGTAKVWNVATRSLVATLPDHETSVCVTGLETSKGAGSNNDNLLTIATGSVGRAQNNQISGHTVRIWTVDVVRGDVQKIGSVANDHEGPIRDICQLGTNTNQLATCSNDGTVKVRSTVTGEALSTLTFLQQQQHPPMLLSVTSMDDGSCVAASAEDGHVVVWNTDGDMALEPLILLHPSCVWKVVGLPNGDLATCCQDGYLRIFTRASDRMAPMAERELYAQTVQEAHKKKSSGPTAEEVAKLPFWEQNSQKQGSSEGQVQLFQKSGIAIAAQWSAASQTWIEVGQVMGSSADGGHIDGVQYDHVLPIEVDQTGGAVARLQIGYNNGENTFVAAQRFIDAHMLPQHHLNDIADYISQRVGKEAPTLGGGGGAAQGGGGLTPVAVAGDPMVQYEHLPMKGYKSFELPAKTETTTMEKMKKKITEFGKISEAQLMDLESLMETLAATSRYHASKITPFQLKVISDMLDNSPPAETFPALDLARLAATHPDAASNANVGYWTQVVTKALSLCEHPGNLVGPAAVAIPMLSLRLFVNAFKGGPGSRQAVVSQLDAMVRICEKFTSSTSKNVRMSVATLLYNISYYLHSQPTNSRPEIAALVVAAVDEILKQFNTYETEAMIRALVALGTTALASPVAKQAAKQLYVVSRVEMAASPHGDIAKTVAKEVYNALQ